MSWQKVVMEGTELMADECVYTQKWTQEHRTQGMKKILSHHVVTHMTQHSSLSAQGT